MKEEFHIRWCMRVVYFVLILSFPLCKILRSSTESTQISKALGSPGWTAEGRSRSLPQHTMSQQKGFADFPLSVKLNIPPASGPRLYVSPSADPHLLCLADGSQMASRSPALQSPLPGSSPPGLPDLNPFPLTSRS